MWIEDVIKAVNMKNNDKNITSLFSKNPLNTDDHLERQKKQDLLRCKWIENENLNTNLYPTEEEKQHRKMHKKLKARLQALLEHRKKIRPQIKKLKLQDKQEEDQPWNHFRKFKERK